MARPVGEDSPLAPPQPLFGGGPAPAGALALVDVAVDVEALVDVAVDVEALVDVVELPAWAVLAVATVDAVVVEALVVVVDVAVAPVVVVLAAPGASRVPPGDSAAQPFALDSGPIGLAALAPLAPASSAAAASTPTPALLSTRAPPQYSEPADHTTAPGGAPTPLAAIFAGWPCARLPRHRRRSISCSR
jgi:hypothetical protein